LEREPDLILMTGDMIDDDSGITPLLDALSGMEARLGKFYVFGSHDYLHGSFRLPTKYLTGRKTSPGIEPVDTDRMVQGLEAQGWKSLMNTTVLIEDEGHTIRLSGVDDPYMDRHRTEHIARAAHDIVAIGLTHAPDVVSEWFLTGFDLVLAGHTHGGQVRFPLIGALVTNSSLPAALAAGLHEVGSGRLHVSPGLGASRYTPIRFLCRPEATLLRLRPGSRPKR
jgi:predicted MPP superfamily phosphohydrolase